MSKTRRRYVCSHCGATATSWMGRCPECREWDTMVEEVLTTSASNTASKLSQDEAVAPELLSGLSFEQEMRVKTGDPELERVLGGGIVPGSVILLAGEPGAGKSTLLLQLAANPALRMLYVSGEESKSQIKMRADRLGIQGDQTWILSETDLTKILQAIQEVGAGIVVIDSIQTIFSPELESVPGSVAQIRECSYRLQQHAKQNGITVILVGHITKEGDIAGPKLMEHIVDVVLQLEGDRQYHLRLLRSAKNRFGSTREIGIYEMRGEGLSPVENPSEWLIPADDVYRAPGSCIGLICEGFRPFLIETQALVSTAVYGTAQRSTSGYDIRRLHLMLAVLEKRCGFYFGNQDVFLNIAGGFRVSEPAVDMAVAVALVSSLQDIAVPRDYCFAGEIGLSGEIRPIQQTEKRIDEATRLGYKKIFIPALTQPVNSPVGEHVVQVRQLNELFAIIFG